MSLDEARCRINMEPSRFERENIRKSAPLGSARSRLGPEPRIVFDVKAKQKLINNDRLGPRPRLAFKILKGEPSPAHHPIAGTLRISSRALHPPGLPLTLYQPNVPSGFFRFLETFIWAQWDFPGWGSLHTRD